MTVQRPTPSFVLGGHTIDIDALIAAALAAAVPAGTQPLAFGRWEVGSQGPSFNCTMSEDGTGRKNVLITSGYPSNVDAIVAVATIQLTGDGENEPSTGWLSVRTPETPGGQFIVRTYDGEVATNMSFSIVFYAAS